MQDAWTDVRNAAEDVRVADPAALESADDALSDAIEDAPEDIPAADEVAGLEPQVQQVAQAWREMSDGLGCSRRTSPDASGQ